MHRGENQIEVQVTGSHRSLLRPRRDKTTLGISGPWHL